MSISSGREADDRAVQDEGHCETSMGACAEEIARPRWRAFCDEFSKTHGGDEVSVEIRGEASGGAHWLNQQTPLVGLVGSEEHDGGSIEIILGTVESGPISHVVDDAQKLWQQRDGRGREVLQIVSADGTSTILTILKKRT